MPLESLKCPQCGANIEVNVSVHTFFCTYCGTKLQASVSNMGVVSASILGEIKEDTSILAKRQALAHLKEQLPQLLKKREDLMAAYYSEKNSLYWEASFGAGLFKRAPSKQSVAEGDALKAKYTALVKELDVKIVDYNQKISSLSSELDRLASSA